MFLCDSSMSRRTALAFSSSLLFATVFAGSFSVGEAVSKCELLSNFGGQELTLDASTKLSVIGFDANVNYVTVPGGKCYSCAGRTKCPRGSHSHNCINYKSIFAVSQDHRFQ